MYKAGTGNTTSEWDRIGTSEWKIAMRMKYMEQFNVVAAEEYATIKRVHI